jgi:hypothetical protein
MTALRALVVGLVLTLTSALPILAQASPPDPSWIPGIYDDADFDDVVTLVVMGTGILLEAPVDLWIVPRVVEAPTVPESAPPTPRAAPNHSRAPPTS